MPLTDKIMVQRGRFLLPLLDAVLPAIATPLYKSLDKLNTDAFTENVSNLFRTLSKGYFYSGTISPDADKTETKPTGT
jgi:hypothetical protein